MSIGNAGISLVPPNAFTRAGIVNVKDFGAVGDGVTDDTTAFADFTAAVGTDGTGYIPAGTYGLTSLPAFAATAQYLFDPGAVLLLDGVPQQRLSYYHHHGEPYQVRVETFAAGVDSTAIGSTTANTKTVALSSAGDWQNGQGLRIAQAGTAATVSAPGAPTVTPTGTAGATSYDYQVVAVDANGGTSATSTSGSTTTGNATLSTTNYNAISWTAVSGASLYAVYRTLSGGTPGTTGYIGTTSATTFNDVGLAVITPPFNTPAAPPTSAGAAPLKTQIVNGGGTTTLTVVDAAGTTAQDQTVQHDDTVALQAALDSADYPVYLAPGTYRLTATLTAQPDQIIWGDTPTTCILKRDIAYGHTIQVGSTSDHAGAVAVSGIWFYHEYQFNNGTSYVAGTSTDIWNKNPTAAHLNITDGQNVRIRDCWFWGLGYGIQMVDTTVIWIDRCIFNGMWDTNVSGLQDTTAGIHAYPSTSSNRCAEMNITNCAINGYARGAPVQVTVGNVTVTKERNAGMLYGVFIESCEQFNISDCYLGGQSSHSIYLSAKGITNHGSIHDNDLDGAGYYSILMEAANSSSAPNYITIHHNTGVGYDIDEGFLFLFDNSAKGGTAPLTYIDVSHNVVQDYYQTPIIIKNARAVQLCQNTVSAYNGDGDTSGNTQIESGCYIGSTCSYINSSGNVWGGGVNDPTSSNHCKWGIYFASMTNNTTTGERSAGLGQSGGGLVYGETTLTPPAQPLANNVTYQNTYGQDIIVYQPITYLPTGSTASTLAITLGPTNTPPTISTNSAPAGSTSGKVETITLRVPAGWSFSFVATNATIGDCTFLPT